MADSFKVGEAPWEKKSSAPGSFAVGEAPWEKAPTQQEEPNGLLKTIGDVGSFVDSYTGAPTRAAIGAAQDGNNPFTAFGKQFREDPELAPTGKQIAQKAGVTDRPVSDFVPSLYYDDKSSGYGLKKGGFFDPTISGAVGAGVDLAADPTNLIPVGKVVEGASGLLRGAAESKALKTTGAMLKDYKKIMGKKQAAEVGRVMLDEKVAVPLAEGGTKAEGLLKAGDTYEDVAKKAKVLKEDTGKQIGEIYKNVEATVNDPAKFSKIPEADQLKIIETSINPTEIANEMRSKLKDFYKGKALGSEQAEKMEKVLADLEGHGAHMTLPQAIEYKNSVDALVDHAKQTKELPAYQQKLNDLARGIQDKITNHVDVVSQVLGGKDGTELKRLNKLYGTSSEIGRISGDRVSREAAKDAMGLINTGVGGVGAVVGAMSAQNPEDAIQRGLLGASAGVASKYIRKYGGGIAARALDLGAKAASPAAALAGRGLLKAADVQSIQNTNDKVTPPGLLQIQTKKDKDKKPREPAGK